MSLLVEWTMNDEMNRFSNKYLALEYPWKSAIKRFSVSYKLDKQHGGWIRPDFGNITLDPNFFSKNNWPPPRTASVLVKHTTGNDSNSVKLFNGEAYWSNQQRGEVTYTIYGTSNDYNSTKDRTFTNKKLSQVASTLCGATGLNLTVSTANARTFSEGSITHTMRQNRLAIDFLNDLCAYYSHMFYIDANILYLIDMNQNNSSRDLGFKYFPPEYLADRPISSIISTTIGGSTAVSVFSSYSFGDELNIEPFDNSTDSRTTNLNRILNIVNKQKAIVSLPSSLGRINPGERLKWIDTRFPSTVKFVCKINAREITYDYTDKRIIVMGEGTITS